MQTQKQPPIKVLYVNNRPQELSEFRDLFKDTFDVFLASDVSGAQAQLQRLNIDVIVSEHCCEESVGLNALEAAKSTNSDIARILIVGFTDVDHIIEAVKRSDAFRFLTRPYEKCKLVKTIYSAYNYRDLSKANKHTKAKAFLQGK